ncbi:alpha-galactosidase-like protein [Mucilaginibacter yixingensis]|uniref:Alpha-galactosidase-like protein n=1 Tax=Mucilaginibacter yixingensis TaxID=1295612 RepID=A0A2T5JEB3_9SPHI|nr:NEW3 domain-containing protein [Mucilaginibacter yixingensis]PTR00108.1 alpha-galactosidase-like protein [Mucilaginibacter yixingensis]
MLSNIPTTNAGLLRRLSSIILILFISGFLARAQQPPSGAKSAFTAKLMNIEAASNEIFRYTTTLHNGSASAKVYELKPDLPAGWMIAFKVDGTQVTSINMDAGKSQDISVEINAAPNAPAKKYVIPIRAVAKPDSLSLNLEAVVKGTYGIFLSTPTGRLSDEVTSGSQKQLPLVVKNTGTLTLNNAQITAQLPAGWEATYEPSAIKQLGPGQTADITATLKVPDKTLAGDYSGTFTATSGSTNTQIAYRLTVKTSLLSGWIGILLIFLAIGIVYYLIRKYGRR